jgi:hypothetical protein
MSAGYGYLRISPHPGALQASGMAQRRHANIGWQGCRIAAVLGLLLACPGAFARSPHCETRTLHARQSIPAGRLANWAPIDDHTLLIWTLHDSRAYLVELSRPVPGLLDAPGVYLVTHNHDPNVCACDHDEVIVPDGGIARIASIRHLSVKRTAELDPDGDAPSRVRTAVI